jgi:hypothetical protein
MPWCRRAPVPVADSPDAERNADEQTRARVRQKSKRRKLRM